MESLTGGWFWCSRCGTIGQVGKDVTPPALVGRCRKFAAALKGKLLALWHSLGVDEAVRPESERLTKCADCPKMIGMTKLGTPSKQTRCATCRVNRWRRDHPDAARKIARDAKARARQAKNGSV